MNPLNLESTTYHYAVKAPEGTYAWPDLHKEHTTMTFRPDVFSFDVHVTAETHAVRLRNIRASGFRVVKDGLSEHRVTDHYYGGLGTNVPPFFAKYIERVVAHHTGTPESQERPEHRACRRQS